MLILRCRARSRTETGQGTETCKLRNSADQRGKPEYAMDPAGRRGLNEWMTQPSMTADYWGSPDMVSQGVSQESARMPSADLGAAVLVAASERRQEFAQEATNECSGEPKQCDFPLQSFLTALILPVTMFFRREIRLVVDEIPAIASVCVKFSV